MTRRQDQHDERAQATVEFALVLPLIAVLALLIVQVVLVGRAQIVLQSAVREAARSCAVNPSCDASSIVSSHIDLPVDVGTTIGTDVTVIARTAVPVIVPLINSLGDVEVTASATMRVEDIP